MGDDDPRLRWHRLHDLSSEVKAIIDGRVIHDHRVCIEEPPSGGFRCANYIRHVWVWHF
jgi:hypothetical protein